MGRSYGVPTLSPGCYRRPVSHALAYNPVTSRGAAVTYESILYDITDNVATVTLSKPERLNAFDDQMLGEWADALQEADRDPEVRAVVITGAGRGFCSGMNVAAEAGGSGVLRSEATVSVRRHSLRNRVHPIPRALIQLEKPYIAAINGAAAGAGMDMATMADIRFMSSTARVGMTYVRMGLIPGDGGCYSLPRAVGTQRALDLIWSGRMITAQEALEIGYVMAVYEPEELLPKVHEYAAQIARGPATAVQLSKKLVYRSANIPFDEHLDMAQMAMFIAQSTEDSKEGPRAFVEKRDPQFKGY